MSKKMLLGIPMLCLSLQSTGEAAGLLPSEFAGFTLRRFVGRAMVPLFTQQAVRHFSCTRQVWAPDSANEGITPVWTDEKFKDFKGNAHPTPKGVPLVPDYNVVPDAEYDFSKSLDELVAIITQYANEHHVVYGLRAQVLENCTTDLMRAEDETLRYCGRRYLELQKGEKSLHSRVLGDERADWYHTLYSRLLELGLMDSDERLTVPSDFPLDGISPEKFKRSLVNTITAFQLAD